MNGACLCGAVRFELTGPLRTLVHCHCSRCRKQHGAPFATLGTVALEDLHWLAGKDAIRSHAVPPGGPRHFCRHCGSPTPSSLPTAGIAVIPVGTLENDPGMRPQAHQFTASKAGWHRISDHLPQYEAHPAGSTDSPLPDVIRETASHGAISGSCLCGEVAYELNHPVAMFQCHCSRCRRARGAAHGANLFCKATDFRWTHGETLVVEYKVPEAQRFGVAFCSRCGASVPRASAQLGIVVVPASGLDTDPGIRPLAHIHVASKAPWFEITDDIPQHPANPPSFPQPPPRDSNTMSSH